MSGVQAVFYRELVMLWKKIGKLGYVFAALLYPLIYLFAFGLGMGGRQGLGDGYLPFLVSGIAGVTVMLNSFQQTAMSISVGRLYFRSFQSLILSPVSAGEIVSGVLLAGLVRGLISGALLLMVGEAVFGVSVVNEIFFLGMVAGALCFAAMGAVVGLLVTDVDEISLVNNFFITPMIFFGGSFFPLSNLPDILAFIAGLLPIRALNTVLRAATFNGEVTLCLLLMLSMTLAFFAWGVTLVRNYSE